MLTWKALYVGGETLSQYNEDGTENKYRDIERHRLINFDLLDANGKTVHRTFLRDGQRLIYRRRNFIKLSDKEERHMIYLVGWQMTVITPSGPKNITALNYIYEDGSVALDDARQEDEYQGIELLPEEL